jgi:hypothetical protein
LETPSFAFVLALAIKLAIARVGIDEGMMLCIKEMVNGKFFLGLGELFWWG